jgi:hypothetical protein
MNLGAPEIEAAPAPLEKKKKKKNTTSEQYQNHIHGDKIDTVNTHIGSDYFLRLVQALSLKGDRVKQT